MSSVIRQSDKEIKIQFERQIMIQQQTSQNRTGQPSRSRFVVKSISMLTMFLSLAGTTFASDVGNDNRAPEVPDESLVAPEFNKVHFHGYAQGFQIYTWNGVDWGKATPLATLFDSEGNIVIQHFAGPTWQSNSGSLVVGALFHPPVTVDENSIPWLLLKSVHNEGTGILAEVTFIQRVNTVGGLAPRAPGNKIGDVANVPYTADYFFYRQSN
jgi:hypothetical protein